MLLKKIEKIFQKYLSSVLPDVVQGWDQMDKDTLNFFQKRMILYLVSIILLGKLTK